MGPRASTYVQTHHNRRELPRAWCRSLSRSFPEPVGGRAKRILDLAIAVPLLVLLAPVFVIIAILIRRDSPGPAFYRQTRVGLDGREFRLIKFRTMVDGAEFIGAGLDNDAGDPRITAVGARLRALSIDELPQLSMC